jgi:hypothetical protein
MSLVTTIHGDMDEEVLEKRIGMDESSTEVINWTEYWYNDELVHRSIHMHLKQGIDVFGDTATFS